MKYFCVFDFETDGVDTEVCNPVQVACAMIDPYNLNIVEGSKFCSDMRPLGINNLDTYLTPEREKTIKFHCMHRKCTKDELLEQWTNAPATHVVWKQFCSHVNIYNKDDRQFTAPIPCGANIRNFDLPIVNRLNKKYNVGKLFNYEVVDIRELAFYWLSWDTSLHSRSMDNLRKYFGISDINAHDAWKDVEDSAEIISRFLKLHKKLFADIKFKGAFKRKVSVA